MSTIETELSSRAMLAVLSIGTFGTTKKDKRVSVETANREGAQEDRVSVNKRTIAKDALECIKRIESDARAYHSGHTRPWLDEGMRILPSKLFFEYQKNMLNFQQRHGQEVMAFLHNYDKWIEDARKVMGSLFDESDYPPSEEVEQKFKFNVNILPLPKGSDFRVALGDKTIKKVQEEIDNRLKVGIAAAQSKLWRELASSIANMRDKMAAYSVTPDGKTVGIFRDSLVENLREQVKLLDAMNLTDDPALIALGRKLDESLCLYDAADLRDDEEIRTRHVATADEILRSMEGYI